eukprot:403343143
MKNYGMQIDSQPYVTDVFTLLEPGKIQAKKRQDQQRDIIDLKRFNQIYSLELFRQGFYNVAPIDTWGIFIWKNEEILAIKMLQTFGELIKTIEGNEKRIQNPPKIFCVNYSDQVQDWIQFMKEKIVETANLQVQAVVIVIPDFQDLQKVKRFKQAIREAMSSQIPVNFKIIKASSLKVKLKRQDLFNYKCGITLAKTLIKAGSTPFIPHQLQILERPTMILGIFRDDKGISISATLNKELSYVFSDIVLIDKTNWELNFINLMEKAFCDFKTKQNIFPQKLIVYRLQQTSIPQTGEQVDHEQIYKREIQLLTYLHSIYHQKEHPVFNYHTLTYLVVRDISTQLKTHNLNIFSFDQQHKYVQNTFKSGLLVDCMPIIDPSSYSFLIQTFKQPKLTPDSQLSQSQPQPSQNQQQQQPNPTLNSIILNKISENYDQQRLTHYQVLYDSTQSQVLDYAEDSQQNQNYTQNCQQLKELSYKLQNYSYIKFGCHKYPNVIQYAKRTKKMRLLQGNTELKNQNELNNQLQGEQILGINPEESENRVIEVHQKFYASNGFHFL